MTIEAKQCSVFEEKSDAVIFFLFQNQKKPAAFQETWPQALHDMVAEYAKDEAHFGAGDVFHVQPLEGSTKHIVVCGLGRREEFDAFVLKQAVVAGLDVLDPAKPKDVLIDVPIGSFVPDFSDREIATLITEAVLFGVYRFAKYLSKKDEYEPRVFLCSTEKSALNEFREGIKTGRIFGESTNISRDLANEPSNVLTPMTFAQFAQKEFEGAKVKCTVIDFDGIKKQGLGLLHAVGQGSDNPPCMVILEYQGGSPQDPYYGFVGKGITFDSGGISLKTGEAMLLLSHMKRDMSGAANVLAIVKAASELQLKKNVVGVMALAENMPDGGAFKPGDILKSYGGKTVEIYITDAEGRLVVADGLSYAQKNYKISTLIDVATLTGEVARVFGPFVTAAFCNDNKMYKKLKQASRDSGEYIWRMPLVKSYVPKVKGIFADLRELNWELPNAIASALFLKEFVQDKVSWAHLDIAGTENILAQGGREAARGSTGVGVRMLTRFLMRG